MDESTSLYSYRQGATLAGRTGAGPAFVVGLAMNADQLGALKQLLGAIPVETGAALLIIQPPSASATYLTRDSVLRLTTMPVHDLVEPTTAEPNAVYLLPPETQIATDGDRLWPMPSAPGADSSSYVSASLCTLHKVFGNRTISIVLSPTAAGVMDAAPPALPASGGESGFVNLLLPRHQLAETLLKHLQRTSTAAPVPNSNLASHQRQGVGRDSDDRTQIETALTAINAQLENVLNAATQVSICATDINGTITLFNSGAENMLGYKSSEMVGKNSPEIMHLESEVLHRELELSAELGCQITGFEVFVAYAREGRFERREWTYVRKDGRHLTVNLVVTAMRNSDGEITGFLGVAEDITERKKSEEALRQSEERFDLAVAGSNDGLWDWDIRTNSVYYSPRFKELLGYKDDEFDNTFAAFESHLHPADRERAVAKLRRHLRDRLPYDVEFRLCTKSGHYLWFCARGQAVWDKFGEAIRMAGSLTDLTKRKLAEAALERKAAEVQRVNDTLRLAEADARTAVIQRDQFLAMLSHELRNPLSAILNGVSVLEHPAANDDDDHRARQALTRQAHHMSRLLDDLLDVARITQGKIEFRKEVLNLNDLICASVEALRPVFESRQQLLEVRLAAEPIMVEGDPTRLVQIVENLLTNASRYTPSGGEVALELTKAEHECELSVRDNGCGIDPQKLDAIFDMFFQSDRTLDRSDGGMGVGLTLVRSLVAMHRGTVTAHSDGLGTGSRFVIRLPLTNNLPVDSSESRTEGLHLAPRILLVEDNPDTRQMLQTILQLDGFHVEVAEDGQAGLDAILSQQPDVALIDIGLPKLNGFEVARHVRNQPNGARFHLVALTGYGQTKDRKAVLEAGFDEHLVKPVNPNQLARLLRSPRKPR